MSKLTEIKAKIAELQREADEKWIWILGRKRTKTKMGKRGWREGWKPWGLQGSRSNYTVVTLNICRYRERAEKDRVPLLPHHSPLSPAWRCCKTTSALITSFWLNSWTFSNITQQLLPLQPQIPLIRRHRNLQHTATSAPPHHPKLNSFLYLKLWLRFNNIDQITSIHGIIPMSRMSQFGMALSYLPEFPVVFRNCR